MCRAEGNPANVVLMYDEEPWKRFNKSSLISRPLSMWRYAEFLPGSETSVVSLGEGMTPLVPVPTLGKTLGVPHLYVKDESRNPTWSFKDRMASSAISRAKEISAGVVVVSSSGNAGSSTAAYAARAGLKSMVFTIQEFPQTMRTQMQVYGSFLVACPTMLDRWKMVGACVDAFGWFPIGGYSDPPVGSNPFSVDGYKSIAYEVVEQLEWRAPDVMAFPVGHGDAFSASWRAFTEWRELGLVESAPRMVAAEVFGPLERALREGRDFVTPVPTSPTVAVSAGTHTSTYQALKAIRGSKGTARRIPEQDIIAMQRLLAETEGIYVEMASVLGLAAVRQLAIEGWIREHETVVTVLTAAGIKHPEVSRDYLPEIPLIEPDLGKLRKVLNSRYGYSI